MNQGYKLISNQNKSICTLHYLAHESNVNRALINQPGNMEWKRMRHSEYLNSIVFKQYKIWITRGGAYDLSNKIIYICNE